MEKRERKLMNFEIKPILLERFNTVCKEKGLNKSEVIRSLINNYIEKNSKKG
jgi:metal-responsive CopG/Arc/MetJ family transcriptional regulator